VYNSTDYSPNKLNKFKSSDFSAEAFASIFVNCTDDSKIGNGKCDLVTEDACAAGDSCCFEIKKSEFKESGGFEIKLPPEPYVPEYPVDLKFNLTEVEDFTRDMTVESLA
jgi:hypothetical protein